MADVVTPLVVDEPLDWRDLAPVGLDDGAFAGWAATARAAHPAGEPMIVVRFVSVEAGCAVQR